MMTVSRHGFSLTAPVSKQEPSSSKVRVEETGRPVRCLPQLQVSTYPRHPMSVVTEHKLS